MKTPALLLRFGLGAVMAYAGAVKALDPAAFATSLGNYQLFPAWLIAPLASGLPWLELVLGAALLANRFVAGAALWSCGLSLGFAVALGSAWAAASTSTAAASAAARRRRRRGLGLRPRPRSPRRLGHRARRSPPRRAADRMTLTAGPGVPVGPNRKEIRYATARWGHRAPPERSPD